MSPILADDPNDPLSGLNVRDRRRVGALRRRLGNLQKRIAQNGGSNMFEVREASALTWALECLVELLELRELRDRLANAESGEENTP